MLEPIMEHTFELLKERPSLNETLTARRIVAVTISEALEAAEDASARQDVRAALRHWLSELFGSLEAHAQAHPSDYDAEIALLQQRIAQFLSRPDLSYPATSIPSPPPGSPIGANR